MPVTLAEALAQLRDAIEADFPGFAPVSIKVESGGGYSAIRLPLIPEPCCQARARRRDPPALSH